MNSDPVALCLRSAMCFRWTYVHIESTAGVSPFLDVYPALPVEKVF